MVHQLRLPVPLVTKSNAIARAQWEPASIWEPRIVALVASKVTLSDTDFSIYSISLGELGINVDKGLSGAQYKEIEGAIESLSKASVKIKGENSKNFRIYSIFAMCGYEDGKLIAQFHPDLKPHFLQLQARFTSYNLFEYLALPSIYSQQLFEILKSWSGLEKITISLAELHQNLSTPNHMRKNFKDFRVRVLERALNDINLNPSTSLKFEWEALKNGKAVIAIKFVFDPKLVAAVAKVKKEKTAQRTSKANNLAVQKALDCLKKKGLCLKRSNTKRICDICKNLEIKE